MASDPDDEFVYAGRPVGSPTAVGALGGVVSERRFTTRPGADRRHSPLAASLREPSASQWHVGLQEQSGARHHRQFDTVDRPLSPGGMRHVDSTSSESDTDSEVEECAEP
jgi:hypothetical protein